jgi:hypothetical protein
MNKRNTHPNDAPAEFKANVEEMRILAKKLGCNLHYAPGASDSPPDTIIITNGDILTEQATTQQILETLLTMDSFSWKTSDKRLEYYVGQERQLVDADTFIEAVYQVLTPGKAGG